jgi:hypothetical protein
MTPEMTPVKSSNLKAVGYDKDGQVLHVQFLNGSHYSHAGVSPDHHAALMAAESVGKHYNANIKGKFAHTKVA